VAGSTGTTPSTIAQMARDAIAFLDALELGAVDLLGFSIGSFVAQEIALIRPVGVRRLVLPSSSPARRRRDARLGTRGDRSRGRARAQP
jgi:pimeloyl-ACP methyl ester carboxylesterase